MEGCKNLRTSDWQMWMRAFRPALVASTVLFVSCTTATDRSAEPARTEAAQPAAPSSPAQPALPALPDGPDSLSGNWTLVMGTMTWHVPLAPRSDSPGEYLGTGIRETPDEAGKQVTMEVGAIKEGGDLRAWLGLGVIKCKGRFHSTGQIKGDCIEIGGKAAGPFVAERR